MNTLGSLTRYADAENSMQLKFMFTNPKVYLEPLTVSDSLPFEEKEESNEYSKARQSWCGNLFEELWSSDELNGFPTPKGSLFAYCEFTSQVAIVGLILPIP